MSVKRLLDRLPKLPKNSARTIAGDKVETILEGYRLHRAVINRDYACITTFLEDPRYTLYVNHQDELGRTALHWAAALGDAEATKRLTDPSFPSVDQIIRDRDGKTPLHEAIIRGHNGIVQTFLKLEQIRQDIEMEDNHHRTALHWAMMMKQQEIAQMLIDASADLSRRDDWGRTALYWAVQNPGTVSMHLRLDNFAVVKETVDETLHENGIGLAILLLEAVDFKSRLRGDDSSTCTAKESWPQWRQNQHNFWRVANDHWDFFKEMVTSDYQQFSKGNGFFEENLLRKAAAHGYEAIVQLALAIKKVDVNAKDEFTMTPLSFAAREGHEAIVELLLAAEGIDINVKDVMGRTPLMYAARQGHEAIVQLLLAAEGIDVDAKDKAAMSPLSFARQYGHESTVQSLLATGKVDTHSLYKSERGNGM